MKADFTMKNKNLLPKNLLFLFMLIILSVVFSSCFKKEIISLRKDVNDLKNAQNSAEYIALKNEVEKVLKKHAESKHDFEQLKIEIQKLNGDFDQLKHSINTIKSNATEEIKKSLPDFEEYNKTIQNLKNQLLYIKKLEDSILYTKNKIIDLESKISDLISDTQMSTLSGYENGLILYNKGDYLGAIESFRSVVIKNKPGSKRDNALYWMGESYFRIKEYEQAISSYQNLVDNFPQSDKICLASYKQGEAFLNLNKNKEATVFFEDAKLKCDKNKSVLSKINTRLKKL
ncbi:MAG: tetratricopeptide repeat protein [Pseudomonadota bacterium]